MGLGVLRFRVSGAVWDLGCLFEGSGFRVPKP